MLAKTDSFPFLTSNKGRKPPPLYQKTRGVLLGMLLHVKHKAPKPKFLCEGIE